MRDFQKLSIWQKSHSLTLAVYALTNNFPPEERYGLTSQMRRSVASIPTNIAEGCGRDSAPELKRFLLYASGSCSELQYQLILSRDLKFISLEEFDALSNPIIEIRKMIFAFIRGLPVS